MGRSPRRLFRLAKILHVHIQVAMHLHGRIPGDADQLVYLVLRLVEVIPAGVPVPNPAGFRANGLAAVQLRLQPSPTPVR